MEPFTAQSTSQVDFDVKPIPEENYYGPPKGRCSSSAGAFRPPVGIPFATQTVHRQDFGQKPVIFNKFNGFKNL
jgi:hypothetical protein